MLFGMCAYVCYVNRCITSYMQVSGVNDMYVGVAVHLNNLVVTYYVYVLDSNWCIM